MGYNAAEIFLTFELKYFHENKFFSKIILTDESGAQEISLMAKKEGQKSRGTIPLSFMYNWNLYTVNTVIFYGQKMCKHIAANL